MFPIRTLDLTVEILRDGRYVKPGNLQMTPALDRFKMYQTITFDFASNVGQAIRIIGTPGGTEGFTTIMELQAQGHIDPGMYVASVKIADGQMQRSNIDKIEIRFSGDVTVIRNNVEIVGTKSESVIDMNQVKFDYDSATHWLTLSFPSSLPDDVYHLQLDCAALTDANGLALLDDDENPSDGFYTIEFHRLFGDVDGSKAVDFLDFSLLALYWLNVLTATGLDSNADGILNFLDFTAFAENWLLCF